MKRLLFLVLLASTLPLSAALTNSDIVKMKKAGLSDDTIILSIQKESLDFDTGADALVELKNAGVSDAVIQKMISPTATATAAEPSAASASAPAAMPAAATSAFSQEFPSIAPAMITPEIGKAYFTRFTFHAEDNKYSTTNYARGVIVPINTAVTLVSISGDKMVLRQTDSGQTITVDNVEKYTKKSVSEIARLMLSAEKTPLDKLPAEVAGAVSAGEMRKGMTKELVLMTRGYPPAHETPSTEGDRWVYWSSRFVKLTIVFTNGRLSLGRGIE